MFNKRIEYFFSVVETGSFSGAAKLHLLSQPAISQQILSLEKELNLILFDRSGYRPILTSAGSYFYKETKAMQQNYQDVLAKSKQIQTDGQPILRIGITGPMEELFLPHIVKIFLNLHPHIDIIIKKITFSSGIDSLKNQSIDAAFGLSNDFKQHPALNYIVLLKHQICAVCSKEHAWATRNCIEGKDLNLEPIISLSPCLGNYFYTDFMHSFTLDGVTPNIVKQVDSLEEMLFSVRLNEGIALTSKEVVPNTNDLCVLDITNTHHHANFCIGYIKQNNSLYLKDFLKTLQTYFSKHYN